jgi:hypothetical protein
MLQRAMASLADTRREKRNGMSTEEKKDGWWTSLALRWGVLFLVNEAYWLFYAGNWGLWWARFNSPGSIYARLLQLQHKFVVPYWNGVGIVLGWLGTHASGLQIPRGQFRNLVIDILGAIPLALIWTIFDRRKRSNAVLSEVLYLGVRCWLATGMFLYGSVKVIGQQGIPQPAPLDWIRPLGEISTGQLMWTWLGYSPIFHFFAGMNETLGAILLLFRRTTLLGAFLILPAMAFVTMLDLTFQVGPWSGALVYGAGALYLIGRERRRLAGIFFFAKPTAPAPRKKVWASPRLALVVRGLWVLVVVFGIWSYPFSTFKEMMDIGRRQSPLCGVYRVERFVVDGRELPEEAADPVRWREVAINWFGDFVRVRRMDEAEMLWSLSGDPYRFLVASGHGYHYGDYGKLLAKTDGTQGQLKYKTLPNYRSPKGGPLPPPGEPNSIRNYSSAPFFTVNYVRKDPDNLSLQGNINGMEISADLRRIDNSFLLFRSLKGLP